MVQVLCTRPNASEEISGVKFAKHEKGMLSEEISEIHAAAFLAVSGYYLLGDEDGDGDSDIADLRKRAADLGIEVKGNWKEARLAAEIKRVEDAAAAQTEGDKPAA